MEEARTTADTSTEAQRIQVEILRRKSLEERLRAALDMAEVARSLLERGIRIRHPEYTDRQVRLALHRALLPGALFHAAFPGQEDLPP
jgi:hypothetical protein